MYDPVALHITRAYPQATVTRRAPFLPSYPLAYGQHKHYMRHPRFDVVWQAHDAHDAYVSFFEVQTQEQLCIPLTCPRADVHWVYALKGRVAFQIMRHSDTAVPFQLQASEYAICYAAPADYELRLGTGTTLVVHCCVKSRWLLRAEGIFASPFRPLLRALRRQSDCCVHVAVLPIMPAIQLELLALSQVPAGTRLSVDSTLYQHVAELIRLSQEAVPDPKRSGDTGLLQAVRHYLREQVARGNSPRIEELADALGVTQQHLNRLHRLRYGLSLKPYLTRVRMAAALPLLRMGHSATQVAYRLGYPDENSFRRQFKAYFGFPPTALRK